MNRLVLLTVLFASSTAFAEGLEPYQSIQQPRPVADQPFALAINEPFGWSSGFAIAGSAYARLTHHQAVRLNVASYENHFNGPAEAIAVLAFNSDGDEGEVSGHLLDVSASWMYFPRRVWDGPTFELGLLHRTLETRDEDEFNSNDIVERDGQTIAAHALLGWSWSIRGRVFMSLAAGASRGYSSGTEVLTKDRFHTEMTTTAHYGEWQTGLEGYLRFGVAFGR